MKPSAAASDLPNPKEHNDGQELLPYRTPRPSAVRNAGDRSTKTTAGFMSAKVPPAGSFSCMWTQAWGSMIYQIGSSGGLSTASR